MDLLIYAIINVKTADWGNYDVLYGPTTSNIFAYAFCLSIPILPIILMIFYYRKRNSWLDESFDRRYGAFLVGLDLRRKRKKDKMTIFIWSSLIFYQRRIFLVAAVIYYP